MMTITFALCLALAACVLASAPMQPTRQPVNIERHKKAPDNRGY